jgi:membrane protease YdiL (CAAX protease family)
MQQHKQHAIADLRDRIQQVEDNLRRSPLIRGISYLGLVAVSLELVWRLHKPTGPYAVVSLHLSALPVIATVTYAYASLRLEDRIHWRALPLRRGVVQALQGIGLGTSAFLVWVGIAAARGWVSAPMWGWERTSVTDVAQSVVLLSVGHLAVAWNEEMIFRGYGFDTFQVAIGQRAASMVLIPLFALYHGLDPQQLLGMTAAGLLLTLLRLHSGGLWLPLGCHWAWNTMQTAILGPAGELPSVRPLQIHGPDHWIGRPGSPEPGLLSTLITFALALLVWLWMRHSRAGAVK